MTKHQEPEPRNLTPEERLQHDIEELERGGGSKSVLRWAAIGVAALAIVLGLYYGSGANEPKKPVVKMRDGGVRIETIEPSQGKLSAPPARFRWESVNGRSDYILRILAKGEPKPIVERVVLESTVQLGADEVARLTAGREYIWEVKARAKDGKSLGTGRSYFDL
jgi:hypothetical protein